MFPSFFLPHFQLLFCVEYTTIKFKVVELVAWIVHMEVHKALSLSYVQQNHFFLLLIELGILHGKHKPTAVNHIYLAKGQFHTSFILYTPGFGTLWMYLDLVLSHLCNIYIFLMKLFFWLCPWTEVEGFNHKNFVFLVWLFFLFWFCINLLVLDRFTTNRYQTFAISTMVFPQKSVQVIFELLNLSI